MKKVYECYLWTLSPVHVGSGETFDPTCAYFDRNKKEVVFFDPFHFSKALSGQQRHELTTRIITGKTREEPGKMLKELYHFVRRVAPQMAIPKRRVSVSENLIAHFEETLGRNDPAQFIMQRSAFDEDLDRLYVPGSSLKGAMRTVWLEHLTSDVQGKKKLNEEEILGGSFESDPFRDVRVTDFRSQNRDVPAAVYYARNHKRQKQIGPQRDGSLHQIMEAIEARACFSGRIEMQRSRTVKKPVNLKKLLEYANHRHERMMEEESRLWYDTLRQDYSPRMLLDKLRQARGNAIYLFRIGKHSGAEAVTVDGYRKITIIKGRAQSTEADRPTTFWFAAHDRETMNGATPFGWVALEILTEKTYGSK